ncbi:hypothetical protein F2Q68_00029358 [Brassica cretica]|uniref:Uncharacterized protein n=1 Tax=Brassica cretica TaxID=69181 RepID=A0A8S9GAL5_BRACR|nr:hypothetical protein F2Q68_00029358 [Brassica cretica]
MGEEEGETIKFYSRTLTYMAAVDKVTTLDMTSELVKFRIDCSGYEFCDPPDEECSFSVESLLASAHLCNTRLINTRDRRATNQQLIS